MPVVGSVVVIGEGGRLVVPPRQEAARERDPRDDAHPGFERRGKDPFEGLDPECVDDDLYRGHRRPGDRGERLVGCLHADAVGAHHSFRHERVEIVEHSVAVDDFAWWTVQLDEVEGVGAQVRPRAVGPGAEVRHRVVLQALTGAPTHLRGHERVEPRVGREELGDALLAAAVAVDVGRVEHRHAGLHRCLQDRLGGVGTNLAPVRTELPGAQGDHRHRAPGSSKDAGGHPGAGGSPACRHVRAGIRVHGVLLGWSPAGMSARLWWRGCWVRPG